MRPLAVSCLRADARLRDQRCRRPRIGGRSLNGSSGFTAITAGTHGLATGEHEEIATLVRLHAQGSTQPAERSVHHAFIANTRNPPDRARRHHEAPQFQEPPNIGAA